MTNKTTTRNLTTIKTDIDTKINEYNAFMRKADFNKASQSAALIDEYIKEYAKVAQKNVFESFRLSKTPMLDAIKELTYTVVTVKNGTDEKDNTPIKYADEKEVYIDLLKMQNYFGENIGHAENWQYKTENFNFRMTLGVAKDLGINVKSINDSYAMNKLAKELADGKSVTSNTQKLNALQEVINAMLGDGYKVTSHDVAYLNNIYCKKGRKALTVVCANHRYMRQYIMEIAHKIVCNKEYAVEYKAVKK